MIRDTARLTAGTFDVLVIGGGIYGLTIAADAALRGLTVALVEAGDFGSGSSFNHLRTIHGGLRYLQSLDLARARESIRERRTLARIAPHAVRPLPFVLPLTASFLKGPLAMRAGMRLDSLLGAGRNEGLPDDLHLPSGRVLDAGSAAAAYPELPREGLAGAAVWHDYTTPEPDRLTFSWAMAADRHGAVLANYVEARTLIRRNGRVEGVEAIDQLTSRGFEVAAKVTVNATGGSVDRFLGASGLQTGMPVLCALNLVTRRPASDPALGGRSSTGRYFFRVPWMGRAVFGTWEAPREAAGPDTGPRAGDVAAFLDELNAAFPQAGLAAEDITLVHRGIVPAVRRGHDIVLEKHERLTDHRDRDGLDGLISIAGTKYTTARAVAARVVDRVLARLGERSRPCRTDVTPLPGAQPPDSPPRPAPQEAEAALPEDTRRHLAAAYGTECRTILTLAARDPALRNRLSSDSPVLSAELVHAARHEMVVHLTDAVVRRTPLGALGFPGEPAVESAAAIVGRELGWSEDRRLAEMADLRRFYLGTGMA